MRPGIFVSRTREKLGRILEPCEGQLIYCRSKWKAVEADKCQLSSGQGEPDICLVTIMAVGITQLQLCSAREIEMMETCKCRKAVSISCTT